MPKATLYSCSTSTRNRANFKASSAVVTDCRASFVPTGDGGGFSGGREGGTEREGGREGEESGKERRKREGEE